MVVDELTDAAAVRKAAEEYRSLGKTAFRERYGFGAVQRYWAVVDGQLYDAKAIVGAAYGYQHPNQGPLRHDQFNGGEAGANEALLRLGLRLSARAPRRRSRKRSGAVLSRSIYDT